MADNDPRSRILLTVVVSESADGSPSVQITVGDGFQDYKTEIAAAFRAWADHWTDNHAGAVDRVTSLVSLGVELGEVFEPDAVDVWLRGRNRLLGDRRPVDLIAAGDVDEVRRVVAALADGAFV